MIRAARVLVLSVALVATLTACDPGGDAQPTPKPTSSASSTATPKPNASPAATSASAASVTAPPCTRDALTNEFAFTDGTAGQLHGILTVGNQSGAACSLSGYPTVYVGEPEAAGGMGAPSAGDPADPGTPLDLAPGEAAVAHVTITQAGTVGGCTLVDTDYLVYAPPGIAFEIEVSAQHVYTEPFPGCRNDDISLVTVGGFAAG